MEFISKLINPGSAAVVLLGAFFIIFLGYCLGRISVKGVSLGTAGVFLTALLFGYLFTLPGLKDIPVLSKFFIADASVPAMDQYGFSSVRLSAIINVSATKVLSAIRFLPSSP